MAFAIMRMEKIKNFRGLSGRLDHNTRAKIPENADPERVKNNSVFGGSTADVLSEFKKRMPEKVRKDAVLGVEIMMTTGSEFSGNKQKFLLDAQDWAEKIFGAENIMSCAHHFDETTPHVHMIVMPMKDGKLNAKHFIGGTRNRMAELQQDFWEKVGKPNGLERGKSAAETRARHSKPNFDKKLKELDQREEKIKAAERFYANVEEAQKKREQKNDEAEKIIKASIGMTPNEIKELKNIKTNFKPYDWIQTGKKMQMLKCENYEEWQEKIKAQKAQNKTQGIKTQGQVI